MADFPDATNTGVTSGATLTKYNGTLHITEDNAVISNMEITGDIVIDAKNVTLSNIKLTSTGAWTAIRVMDDATGFTLQNSEIDGKGLSQNGIYGHGTFIGNDIYGVENGITVSGPTDFRDNYIHNFLGTAEAHYDGVEVNAGHDIDIVHNTIVVDHGQTSAVMLDNWAGGLSNITVENNRLAGGGYTVYLDDTFGGGPVDDSSIKIINNQVGDGQWGDFSLYGNNPVMYGNTDLNTLPADTTPTDTTPTDTAPVGTTTADAAPADTTTTDAAPAGTTTTDTTATDAVPADTTPTDTTPADTTATDAVLADTTATDITSPTAPTHTAQTDTPPGTSSTGTAVERPTTDSEADTGLDGPLEGTSGDTDSVANGANNGDAKGAVHDWIKQTFGSNFADKFHGNTHTHSSLALGADDLMGGSDADTLVFNTAGESTSSLTDPDSIFDFSGTGGDRTDIADIDANSAASGDQAFTYLGTAAFTGKAGELRDAKQASDTYVYGDTNGDRNADCAVHLDDAVSLSKGYFVL